MSQQSEALEIIEEVLSFGYRQILAPSEFFGEELMERMIIFGCRQSDKFLGEYIDYWESVHRDIPSNIRRRYIKAFGEDPADWE